MARNIGRRQRRINKLRKQPITQSRPRLWRRFLLWPNKTKVWWASADLTMWFWSAGLVLIQSLTPMFAFWCLLQWKAFEGAINLHYWWPTWIFIALYGFIAATATVTAVAIKTALKRQARGQRTLLLFGFSVASYLFVFFMSRGVLESLSKIDGEMKVLTVFYFALYLLFLGWTTKPIWDRATDDWYKRYYTYRYGISPDDDKR